MKNYSILAMLLILILLIFCSFLSVITIILNCLLFKRKYYQKYDLLLKIFIVLLLFVNVLCGYFFIFLIIEFILNFNIYNNTVYFTPILLISISTLIIKIFIIFICIRLYVINTFYTVYNQYKLFFNLSIIFLVFIIILLMLIGIITYIFINSNVKSFNDLMNIILMLNTNDFYCIELSDDINCLLNLTIINKSSSILVGYIRIFLSTLILILILLLIKLRRIKYNNECGINKECLILERFTILIIIYFIIFCLPCIILDQLTLVVSSRFPYLLGISIIYH